MRAICATLLSLIACAAISSAAPRGQGAADDACTVVLDPAKRTLQKALDAAKPGDSICLRRGTYETGEPFGNSADTTYVRRSGQSAAYITLRGFESERPVIHGSFRITASFWKIYGLVFEGPLNHDAGQASARRDNLVEMIDSSNIIFRANEVRRSDYHAGIYLKHASAISISDCDIHNNGRFSAERDPKTGAKTINVDHGIYWGSSAGEGNVIANNRIYANRGYGLHLYPHASHISVVNNHIFDNGNSGVIIAGDSDDIEVVGNTVVRNGSNAQIRVRSGSNNVVRNNSTFAEDKGLSGIENRTRSTVAANVLLGSEEARHRIAKAERQK
jgi:hypothetical protein